jgi:hypothetical protein
MSQQINLFNPVFLQQKKMLSAPHGRRAPACWCSAWRRSAWYGKVRVASLQRRPTPAPPSSRQKTQKRLASVTAEFAPRVKRPRSWPNWRGRSQLPACAEVSGVIARGELGNTQGYAEYFRALARQQRRRPVADRRQHRRRRPRYRRARTRARSGAGAGLPGRLTVEPVMQGKPSAACRSARPPRCARRRTARNQRAPAPYVEFSLQSTPRRAGGQAMKHGTMAARRPHRRAEPARAGAAVRGDAAPCWSSSPSGVPRPDVRKQDCCAPDRPAAEQHRRHRQRDPRRRSQAAAPIRMRRARAPRPRCASSNARA